MDKKKPPYEDPQGFLTAAGEVAESPLEMGITGMKIWPFDTAAEASNGTYISNSDLKKAMKPFEKSLGLERTCLYLANDGGAFPLVSLTGVNYRAMGSQLAFVKPEGTVEYHEWNFAKQ